MSTRDSPSGRIGAGAPALDGNGLARALTRRKTVGLICLALLCALGWAYLGVMTAGSAGQGPLASHGPGMAALDRLLGRLELGPTAAAFAQALCRPGFGTAATLWSASDAALVLLMWVAMVLAMMLPTAGAMVGAYGDMAEQAARRGETVVAPPVLIGGYVAAWVAVAVAGTGLQAVLTRIALLDPAMASASPLFSGAIFIGAGLYQFSALKHACVTRCQQPARLFVEHWASTPRAVFRLGFRQGLDCVGCCWAMMLVMFAVGLMNIVWMAGLGLVMGAEKLAATTRFSRVIGVALVAVGVAFAATAIIGHWPTPAG